MTTPELLIRIAIATTGLSVFALTIFDTCIKLKGN